MKPTRKLNRRSFFAAVAGGAATASLIGIVGAGEAKAMQCSDSDSGPNSDPGGRGRSCGRRRTGCNDSDAGRGSDPVGYGRCRPRRSGCTDNDRGRGSDPAGNGRCRRRSCSDSDSGPNSDPGGRGRSC